MTVCCVDDRRAKHLFFLLQVHIDMKYEDFSKSLQNNNTQRERKREVYFIHTKTGLRKTNKKIYFVLDSLISFNKSLFLTFFFI